MIMSHNLTILWYNMRPSLFCTRKDTELFWNITQLVASYNFSIQSFLCCFSFLFDLIINIHYFSCLNYPRSYNISGNKQHYIYCSWLLFYFVPSRFYNHHFLDHIVCNKETIELPIHVIDFQSSVITTTSLYHFNGVVA